MHGQISFVYHSATAERCHLFSKIPSPFEAVRYHSLAVSDLPACLESFASTDDGTIMGIRHKTIPFWGVQFHPEVSSSFNFFRIVDLADPSLL